MQAEGPLEAEGPYSHGFQVEGPLEAEGLLRVKGPLEAEAYPYFEVVLGGEAVVPIDIVHERQGTVVVEFAYSFEDSVYIFAHLDVLLEMEAAPVARLDVANAAQLAALSARQASRCTGSS